MADEAVSIHYLKTMTYNFSTNTAETRDLLSRIPSYLIYLNIKVFP